MFITFDQFDFTYRETMIQTLKALLLDMKADEVRGLWANSIHWMNTLAFGHTAGAI